ncbi:Insulin-like growth factor binding N-terminal [Chlorella sorokiniana]|uniref:Insulin-like growth factor binding N-terminal n=1 Tax=Chlorella sorokiniana TaxID=3076 RepID=A0A2P6TP59_CHLSO|nr:Insulin-like growth factor binding N-terminal [Chlorella sorokiniana]|eukprot:PRW51117.1 Insulin-like growth factor binding N-terminal [Chlorella sorokiniana]
MARLAATLLLALGLIPIVAGGAAAAAAPQCRDESTARESCEDRRELTAEGRCVQCNATTTGAWQEACASCKPEDPRVCLKCENYCNTNGCTGYYVTREGGCSRCPAGAAACDDLTGEITECQSGLGLVGGECRPCKVEGCQTCNGDLSTCTKCVIQRASELDGFFADATTGTCKACDAGCKACTGTGACLECTRTVMEPAKQVCLESCTVANCHRCSQTADKCEECEAGLRLNESSNTCVPCGVAHCSKCSDDSQCSTCMPGYGLTDPQGESLAQFGTACHACAKPDPNCLACNGNATVCSQCADGMAPDPTTGLCVLCRLANARTNASCSAADATRCDDYYQCAEGFYCHNVTGQCTACPEAGCASCHNVISPDGCTECMPGYWDASQPIIKQKYRASPLTDLGERWA